MRRLYRFSAAPFVRYVEEKHIFARYDVRNTIAIVGHGPKTTPCTNTVGVLIEIHPASLAMGGL